mmetsp:Transcript_90993/g.136305  ORF Transcript_90993/g.136305 Transcript_90993/m.136305 type:complete len:268 (+) Transcript_90993:66-869(+)
MVTERLQDGAIVTIEYRISSQENDATITENPDLAWHGGEELDSSHRRGQDLTFEVGAKMVLPALDHAVRVLNQGESKVLAVVAREAVGADRCKEMGVRESKRVCCAVRVVHRKNERAELKQVAERRLQQASAAKDSGNALFKQKKPREALKYYRQGRKKLEGFDKEKLDSSIADQCRALLLSLLLNCAACSLQLGEPRAKQTVTMCSKALALDASSVKAFFRRAMAHKLLDDHEAAVADLRSALRLEPANQDVMKEIVKLAGVEVGE